MDLITGTLEANPNNRLGKTGMHELKAHPFFASIDFVALAEKRVPVPFVPDTTRANVDTSTDYTYPYFQ